MSRNLENLEIIVWTDCGNNSWLCYSITFLLGLRHYHVKTNWELQIRLSCFTCVYHSWAAYSSLQCGVRCPGESLFGAAKIATSVCVALRRVNAPWSMLQRTFNRNPYVLSHFQRFNGASSVFHEYLYLCCGSSMKKIFLCDVMESDHNVLHQYFLFFCLCHRYRIVMMIFSCLQRISHRIAAYLHWNSYCFQWLTLGIGIKSLPW